MRTFLFILFSTCLVVTFAQEQTKEKEELKKEVQLNNNMAVPATPSAIEAIPVTKEEEKLKDSESAVGMPESTSVRGQVIWYSNQVKQVELQSNIMRSQRTPSEAQQLLLNSNVENLEKIDNKSFEYNFYKYVAGNHNTTLYPFLAEAERLNPTSRDVHAQLAAYYVITQNKTQSMSYLEKLLGTPKLGTETYFLSHDILFSVPLDGILVTHGFEDTYSCYYTQLNSKVREDVLIVSLELLQSELYRNSLKIWGVKLPQSTQIDVAYLQAFCTLNADRNVSVSMTLPKEYLEPIKSNLYTSGLVFEYRTEPFDNYSHNDFLWKVYFDKELVRNSRTQKGNELSANYLPMLLILRDYYGILEEEESLKEVNEAIELIAKRTNKEELVKKLTKSD